MSSTTTRRWSSGRGPPGEPRGLQAVDPPGDGARRQAGQLRGVVPVVGYGTNVEVPEAYDDLTRTLLRAAQRCREFDLRVRHRRCPCPSVGWTFVGAHRRRGQRSGRRLGTPIERELPIVAEGLPAWVPADRAVRIARSFVAPLHRVVRNGQVGRGREQGGSHTR